MRCGSTYYKASMMGSNLVFVISLFVVHGGNDWPELIEVERVLRPREVRACTTILWRHRRRKRSRRYGI